MHEGVILQHMIMSVYWSRYVVSLIRSRGTMLGAGIATAEQERADLARRVGKR